VAPKLGIDCAPAMIGFDLIVVNFTRFLMALLSVRSIRKHCLMHGIRNKRKLESVSRRNWKSKCMAVGAASLNVFLSERDLSSGTHLVMKQDLYNQRRLTLRS